MPGCAECGNTDRAIHASVNVAGRRKRRGRDGEGRGGGGSQGAEHQTPLGPWLLFQEENVSIFAPLLLPCLHVVHTHTVTASRCHWDQGQGMMPRQVYTVEPHPHGTHTVTQWHSHSDTVAPTHSAHSATASSVEPHPTALTQCTRWQPLVQVGRHEVVWQPGRSSSRGTVTHTVTHTVTASSAAWKTEGGAAAWAALAEGLAGSSIGPAPFSRATPLCDGRQPQQSVAVIISANNSRYTRVRWHVWG